MPEDRHIIQAGLGQKGQMPEGAQLHKTQMREEAEISGRGYGATLVVCPYCNSVCQMAEEAQLKRWLDCWNCHQPFSY